jgi:hypothetical protein
MRQRIRDSVRVALWSLPYEVRRRVYRTLRPSTFRAYQRMRRISPAEGNSLRPFDALGCIFIHVPKCAGISVGKALFGVVPGSHISVLTYQLIYPREEYERYFKCAFIRNPWDRLLSAFRFLTSGGMTEKDRRWADANLKPFADFDDFVRRWVSLPNVSSWQHFKPQHRFICDPWGRVQVDFVGRFERLEEDVSTIARRIGVEGRLPRLNQGPPRDADYRSYYTTETRDIVADAYRRDIELFGYDFDS